MSSLNARFIKACKDHHFDEARRLLEEGADAQCSDEDGWTAAHHASYTVIGLDFLKELLRKHNALKESITKSGFTPLHIACPYGKLEVVKYLIEEAGCNKEATSHDGSTPLHRAAWCGQLEVVKYLIEEAGCNKEATSHDGSTPLHWAAWAGKLEVVKYLIEEASCSKGATSHDGSTPMHWAAWMGELETVSYLVSEAGCNKEATDSEGQTPLHHAAKDGELETVRYLIGEGCNKDAVDEDGDTALHLAACEGQVEVVKYLVSEAGFNKEATNSKGQTPLQYAAINGRLETVRYLIEEGCNKDAVDEDGDTALHLAAKFGRIGVVSYLLQAGSDPNAVDDFGNTALDVALGSALKEVFRSHWPVGPQDVPTVTQDPQFPGISFLGTPRKREVSSQGQEISWDRVGIAFSIPPGAVPDDESLKLAVQPSLTGPFQPPDDCELTSPSYHITHSTEFTKDVEIILYHSVKLETDEDCKRMTFLSAPGTPTSSGTQSQYEFKKISGGVFKKNENIGRIKLRHFCHVATGITGEKPQSVYSARLYRNSATPNGPCTRALFCIVPYQPMYTEHLKKYLEKNEPELMNSLPSINGPVEFASAITREKVTLQLPTEIPGYKISCDQDPVQISKKKVDFIFTSPTVPEQYPMKLFLNVLCVGGASPQICKLTVLGLDEDLSFKLALGTFSASEVKVKSTTVGPCRAYTVEGLLTVADFKVVYTQVYRQRVHWRPIGERLGLDPSDLENYEDEYKKNDQRLRKVILEWLRKLNLKPCWKTLIDALKHQTVDDEGAACDLEKFVKKTAETGEAEREMLTDEEEKSSTGDQGHKVEKTPELEKVKGEAPGDISQPFGDSSEKPSGDTKEEMPTEEETSPAETEEHCSESHSSLTEPPEKGDQGHNMEKTPELEKVKGEAPGDISQPFGDSSEKPSGETKDDMTTEEETSQAETGQQHSESCSSLTVPHERGGVITPVNSWKLVAFLVVMFAVFLVLCSK